MIFLERRSENNDNAFVWVLFRSDAVNIMRLRKSMVSEAVTNTCSWFLVFPSLILLAFWGAVLERVIVAFQGLGPKRCEYRTSRSLPVRVNVLSVISDHKQALFPPRLAFYIHALPTGLPGLNNLGAIRSLLRLEGSVVLGVPLLLGLGIDGRWRLKTSEVF